MSQDMINNRFLEESVFAIADGYCVINLTKSIVRGSMYQVVNGKKYNLNEQLGLPENSSLQSLVDAWALTIPEEGLQDFLHEFDRERLLKRFENGERHISFRYWTRTATFEPMLAEDHMALYREEETGDIIAVNYVLDRTEHYRLEEKERALEKSNREYAKLLEEEKKHTAMIEELTKKLQSQLELFTVSIPGGVKISNDDPEYSFKYVSEQFANMLGYATPKELLDASGGNIIGLAHPDDVKVGLADALNQYTHSDHYATIYRIRCKDGTYKYIEDRGQKVIKEDGTIEHWNLMLDKNDFMHKSIALESEKKANKSKSDFLSRMSHDMRTPLNGIIGLLKIAEKHFDDRELDQPLSSGFRLNLLPHQIQ